jgi:hypothetical protein
MSLATFSSGCPLCSATVSSIRRLSAIASRPGSRAIRLPFAPAASRSAPSDIAIPTEMVAIESA